MSQLTIYTHRYSKFLECFAIDIAEGDAVISNIVRRKGGLFLLNCNVGSREVAERLLILLIDIAMQENPIYKQSSKLQEMAGDLRGTRLYASLRRNLIRFVKHNRVLHLEGYMTFRMTEYREKLDMMSYSLIKKMKLCQQD